MSSLTSRLGLYKPADNGSENVNVVTDLNNNLDKLDAMVGVRAVTSSTRPGTPYSGQMIRETDTAKVLVHDGTVPASAGWTVQLWSTGSTFTGDATLTGNVMAGGFLRSTRTSTAQGYLSGRLATDTVDRLTIFGDGKLSWGAGASAAQDTSLYRSASASLKTDGLLEVGGALNVLGNTTLSGTVAVAGNLSGNLTITGNLTVAGIGSVRAAGRVTDSAARASTVTPTDDGVLQVSVDASALYLVEGYLRWSCASSTPGIRVRFTGPTGAVMYRSFFAQPPANTGTTGTMDTGTQATIGGDDTRQSINGAVGGVIKGLLTTSATAGTLALQWAQSTSNASGVTMSAGSWLKITRIG